MEENRFPPPQPKRQNDIQAAEPGSPGLVSKEGTKIPRPSELKACTRSLTRAGVQTPPAAGIRAQSSTQHAVPVNGLEGGPPQCTLEAGWGWGEGGGW